MFNFRGGCVLLQAPICGSRLVNHLSLVFVTCRYLCCEPRLGLRPGPAAAACGGRRRGLPRPAVPYMPPGRKASLRNIFSQNCLNPFHAGLKGTGRRFTSPLSPSAFPEGAELSPQREQTQKRAAQNGGYLHREVAGRKCLSCEMKRLRLGSNSELSSGNAPLFYNCMGNLLAPLLRELPKMSWYKTSGGDDGSFVRVTCNVTVGCDKPSGSGGSQAAVCSVAAACMRQ